MIINVTSRTTTIFIAINITATIIIIVIAIIIIITIVVVVVTITITTNTLTIIITKLNTVSSIVPFTSTFTVLALNGSLCEFRQTFQNLSPFQFLFICIFQLMKLAYDEEVGTEMVELFRKRLHAVHAPQTVFSSFAFVGKGLGRTPTFVIKKQMERQGTLRKTRKKFHDLTTSSKRVSLPNLKGSTRRKKYGVGSSPRDRPGSPSGSMTDDDSVVDISDIPVKVDPVVQGVDRLNRMPCCQDYSRLGFGNVSKGPGGGPWRITMVNYTYTVCRRYESCSNVCYTVSSRLANTLIQKLCTPLSNCILPRVHQIRSESIAYSWWTP